MPRLRPLIAIGAGLLVAIAIAGCGGDDKSSVAAAAGGSGGSSTRINLSESAAKLSTLQSFRFSGSASLKYDGTLPSTADDDFAGPLIKALLDGLKDIKVEGAVVAPDQAQISVKANGDEYGFVQIKDQAWAKFMGGWVTLEPDDLGHTGSFDFSDLTGAQLPQEVIEAAKVSKDKVNGIDATKYSFDKAALEKLADVQGDTAEVDSADLAIWLTNDGIPVKFSLNLKGKDENGAKIQMQAELSLSDLNQNISIKAPK